AVVSVAANAAQEVTTMSEMPLESPELHANQTATPRAAQPVRLTSAALTATWIGIGAVALAVLLNRLDSIGVLPLSAVSISELLVAVGAGFLATLRTRRLLVSLVPGLIYGVADTLLLVLSVYAVAGARAVAGWGNFAGIVGAFAE